MPDGASFFEDINIALNLLGPIGSLSKSYPATSVVFREIPPDHDFDWHPSPHGQYIVLLDGQIEIETGTSEKRRFHAADILLMEDTWGSGHRTSTKGGKVCRFIFVHLAEQGKA